MIYFSNTFYLTMRTERALKLDFATIAASVHSTSEAPLFSSIYLRSPRLDFNPQFSDCT